MRYELAQQFTNFELPSDVKQAWKAGMMFANEVQLNNDDIDYFVSMPPRRMEDESYEDMKIRTQFTNKLNKYRAHLYDYSVYEKQ
jgi:DNA-binding cell septation regulator SpoVG